MVKYMNCTLSELIVDAKENGRVDYLKTLANKKLKDKNGKSRKISFLELRRAYYEKYYEDMLPQKKSKKLSMYDMIDEL